MFEADSLLSGYVPLNADIAHLPLGRPMVGMLLQERIESHTACFGGAFIGRIKQSRGRMVHG